MQEKEILMNIILNNCKWQPGPDFEYFTYATADEQHYQNCDYTECKKARFEK